MSGGARVTGTYDDTGSPVVITGEVRDDYAVVTVGRQPLNIDERELTALIDLLINVRSDLQR